MGETLIEVKDLELHFKQKSSKLFSFHSDCLKAVDKVSFTIKKGETFGLVGESGSGKSTIGKAILRYYTPTGGEIYYQGTEIGHRKESQMLPYRKKMQSVFQDPYSSLDPSHTIREIICEPMEIHRLYTAAERKEKAEKLIEVVGLKKVDLYKYPHEFSGGQRQRISIARALSVQPEFVVCDEPISALDVSLQAQIIHLLEELQDQYGLTYLFISHQLQVVQKLCDRIGVLYLGSILETSDSAALYKKPLHPYTKMLISSILPPDPTVNALDEIVIESGVQKRTEGGCKFKNRCQSCMERCRHEPPSLKEAEPGHWVACHLYEKSHEITGS
ncbi:ABC transporter ATP-binding protein [Lacrimispora sp.]|uniref:ABC transporter ATP-binding protein n=1 Tax=Lacrimispora sp. TaxID=2719234 RepID=UPI0039920EAD